MTILRSEGAGETSGDFYRGVATQSLRFNDNDTASLSWSPSSAGNRKKWTFSTWVKRSTITNASSGDQYIFSQATGSNNNDSFIALIFRGDDLDVTCHSLEVLRSDAKFRDASAWYHILWVLDTQNSTDSHKMRLYVNGDEITSFSTDNRSNSQLDGTDMPILNNATHYIGRYGGDTSRNFDGYLAYTELVEGEALTPSSFTEEKNGALIPKKYTGDHGTFGFRLEYKETGDGSSSPSTSTIGADTKSNATKQHWNDNNLDAYDSNMPDSPENNFCTLSPLFLPSNTNNQILEAGLIADATSSSWSHVPATWAWLSGKWYWEISAANTAMYAGAVSPTVANDSANALFGWDSPLREAWLYHPSGLIRYNGSDQATGKASFSANDILAFAVDISGQTLRIYINNSLQYTASHDFTGWYPAIATINTVYGRFNFGQDGSFSGLFSGGDIGTQTDENGFGAFKYAPPTGYLAMCTANLSEPTIGPNSDTNTTDNFETILYNGNSANDSSGSTQSITGLDFQPDWVWVKNRDATADHRTVDSVRGVQKTLYISGDYYENEGGDGTDGITAFTAASSAGAGGFAVGQHTGFNANSNDFVAFNWKLGGQPTADNSAGAGNTPTAGSVKIDGSNKSDALAGSIAATRISANTNAGVSIITYTGGGSAGDTIAHGLNSAPEHVVFKRRAATGNWMNYVKAMGSDGYMNWDRDNGKDSGGSPVNNSDPSNSLITLGSFQSLNSSGSNNTYVAYAFHSVQGFSKFGSYVGNGHSSSNPTDGTFVYLGFRPAFLIYKRYDDSGNWLMDDNKTQTFNPDSNYLIADGTDAEGDTGTNTAGHVFDMLSNGFKFKNYNSARNGDGNTYIYMAWAETPFKYALAR